MEQISAAATLFGSGGYSAHMSPRLFTGYREFLVVFLSTSRRVSIYYKLDLCKYPTIAYFRIVTFITLYYHPITFVIL
jgi:hypothetical protein